ncbi:MAG TPA: ABC transporter ATP-binding protein [Thermoanaerobaculia bacterium]|nr:ABC transporter ATP-binding protein [Thermoanaerobaculia bacterium]
MSAIELREASYRYPGAARDALGGVTLAIESGSLVSIVGPNGSGKSTLLKLLGRVLEPTGGEMVYRGRAAGAWPRREYARRVGYLPQEWEPVFPIRALDVVLSGRAPHLKRFEWESAEDVESARRALEECDVLGFESRFMDEMSGGERKRVEIARVLAGEPELVLLDEPFAALDLAHVQRLARLLEAIAGTAGRTVVFVSHDLNWSAAVADRMIVLRQGRVAADGSPAEVLTEPTLERCFELRARVIEDGGSRWIVPKR